MKETIKSPEPELVGKHLDVAIGQLEQVTYSFWSECLICKMELRVVPQLDLRVVAEQTAWRSLLERFTQAVLSVGLGFHCALPSTRHGNFLLPFSSLCL